MQTAGYPTLISAQWSLGDSSVVFSVVCLFLVFALFLTCAVPCLGLVPSGGPLRSTWLTQHCKAVVLLQNLGKIEDEQQSLPYFHILFISPLQSEWEPDKPRRGQSFWKRQTHRLLLKEDFPILTSVMLQRLLLRLDCGVYKGAILQCSWQERETWLAAFLWTCRTPSAPPLPLPAFRNPFGEWEVAWVNN